MSRRLTCPLKGYEGAWVELPDEWLGAHAAKRDEALEKLTLTSPTLRQFGLAMVLAENWGGFPQLEGNPDKWEVEKLPLAVISWINWAVLDDFGDAFFVPKVSSGPPPNGSRGMRGRTRRPRHGSKRAAAAA